METRHPVEIYFGREFPAICYRCGVLAAWSRQNWNIFEKFLRFLEKRLLMIKCSNFCSESLHRDTDRRCCVQNSWKSVKSCVIYPTKKKNSAPYQTVATARIAPKVCHGGLVAGRVKAVKTRLKVNPSTRRSYSFSPSKLFILASTSVVGCFVTSFWLNG